MIRVKRPLGVAWPVLFFLCTLGVTSVTAAKDFVDATGRRVHIATPVLRVVSLSPGATEILFAIGAGGRVAGVSRQCDFPLGAKLKPKVGDFNSPDLDKVRAASGELVLFTEYVRSEDLETLERAGIQSVVLAAQSVADIAEAVKTLGELMGRPEEAATVAAQIDAGVADVRSKMAGIADADRPRVYVEVDGPPHELYAVGPGSFMDDVIRLAGGRNAFSDAKAPYFQVSSDEVVRANPDVILVDHPYQYKTGVSKRPGWDRIAAVANGRVYDNGDFDIILLNRPAPRIVQSLREVSRLLHPEAWDVE